MKLRFVAGALLLMATVATPARSQAATPESTKQPCQLISTNPPDFDPYQFVPKQVDFKRINRFPKVAFIVSEDGIVTNIRILNGTGSGKLDQGLVKSLKAWKYKPQPGCSFEISTRLIIDIGSTGNKGH